jgi:hypothetical protein
MTEPKHHLGRGAGREREVVEGRREAMSEKPFIAYARGREDGKWHEANETYSNSADTKCGKRNLPASFFRAFRLLDFDPDPRLALAEAEHPERVEFCPECSGLKEDEKP